MERAEAESERKLSGFIANSKPSKSSLLSWFRKEKDWKESQGSGKLTGVEDIFGWSETFHTVKWLKGYKPMTDLNASSVKIESQETIGLTVGRGCCNKRT